MNIVETAMEHYGKSRLYNREWLQSLFDYCKHDFPVTSNWCAIFIDYVATVSGKQRPDKPAAARSWLKTGIAPYQPVIGDLAIFWRESPSSWKGHVGIYIGKDYDGKMFILGGNQGPQRSVTIQRYPDTRLLGFRRLIDYE